MLCRAACLPAICMAVCAPGTAQPVTLPAPSGTPQSIDFAADPILAFVGSSGGDADFRRAVAEAVARHPLTGEAEAGSAEARAVRAEVRSGLFPSVSASVVGAYSLARRFEQNGVAVDQLIPRGRADAQAGVDQLIYDFGATGGRIAGASARVRAARAGAESAAAQTAISAISAWLQVAGFQAFADLGDARIARHRAILSDTRARFAAGIGTAGDVARAEAGLADAIGSVARDNRSLVAARAAFQEVYGRQAPLRPLRPASATSTAPDAEAAAALAHHAPLVVQALALAEASAAEARAAHGDRLPRLAGGVTATRYAFDAPGTNYDVRGQLVVSQRFSTGGAEAAREDQARARARAAGFASDRLVGEAERDARTAFADARILAGNLDALGDAYRANRRARDAMAEQFRAGRGSLFELLRAEDDYVLAARALVQGSLEHDLARFMLLARTAELLPYFAIPAPR